MHDKKPHKNCKEKLIILTPFTILVRFLNKQGPSFPALVDRLFHRFVAPWKPKRSLKSFIIYGNKEISLVQ